MRSFYFSKFSVRFKLDDNSVRHTKTKMHHRTTRWNFKKKISDQDLKLNIVKSRILIINHQNWNKPNKKLKK